MVPVTSGMVNLLYVIGAALRTYSILHNHFLRHNIRDDRQIALTG